MDPLLIAALTLVSVGACLQGTVGFGMSLTAAPLLIIVNPVYVPGPLLAASLTLGALVLLRDRRAIALREVSWALVGRFVGSVAGIGALAILTTRTLSLTLGAVVLAAVAASATGLHLRISRRSLVGAGVVSGFTATTTGVGGPPIALLYQRSAGEQVRANLAGFFIVGAGLTLALLAGAGRFGAAELRATGILIPGVLLGFVVSIWTRRLVDGDRLRPVVLAVAGLSAAVLIVRTLLG